MARTRGGRRTTERDRETDDLSFGESLGLVIRVTCMSEAWKPPGRNFQKLVLSSTLKGSIDDGGLIARWGEASLMVDMKDGGCRHERS